MNFWKQKMGITAFYRIGPNRYYCSATFLVLSLIHWYSPASTLGTVGSVYLTGLLYGYPGYGAHKFHSRALIGSRLGLAI
jgi:hypothetical protein